MSMPPPIEPEFEKDDEDKDPPQDVRGLFGRIKKLGLEDYIFAFGVGLRAFAESRQRRLDKERTEDAK